MSKQPRDDTSTDRALPSRRKALLGVGAAVLAGAAAWGTWHALYAGQEESTDNAYVQGNVVQITPQLSGTVLGIAADDTDYVQAGQVLVRLDPADAKVALDQAEAALAQTVREVRTLYANNAPLAAQIKLHEADLARARTDLARAQDDVARRQPLLASGAVGAEELNHAKAQLAAAQSAVAAAQAAVAAAREQLASNRALTDGTTVENHPSVQRAAVRVHEAMLALQRTELPAPVSGHVAKRSVQLGQRVAAGAPLMSVIALEQLWVDANFKEGQLQRLRIGQPVTLEADVYGKKVAFHGRVEGLGAGTGAAFSLLPAQNATGNWIKIVQRVPVRIALEPAELRAHPLRIGLSMDVRVDVSHTEGKTLADAVRREPVAQTAVFSRGEAEADEQVRRIVAANLGGAPNAAADRLASAGRGGVSAPLR
jgi:membrane fusion protein (multidrug efflux system)